LEESLILSREVGGKEHIVYALLHLGELAVKQGDPASAHSLYKESLGISHEVGSDEMIKGCLEGLANVMCARHRVKEAVRLWGASSAISERMGGVAHPSGGSAAESARLALGDDAFIQVWEAGRELTMEQVVAFAGEVCV
jgi:hypothetical protein